MSFSHPIKPAVHKSVRRRARPAAPLTTSFGKRDVRRPVYCPSQEEILQSCREIRAGWSLATRRAREMCRIDPMVLTPVHIEGYSPDAFERVA